MDNYIGKLLDNRYEILEVIGTGGMAVVYKARCHRLNRLVAVKILKDEYSNDAEFRRRFHAESQAVAMLSHPNIVAVYDVSKSSDLEYIVMELIDGITLKQYMKKKGVLNWREVLHFTSQIAKALDHAHSRGIIHRDIKPHNIMIMRDGSVRVADFGIARFTASQSTLTQEALGSVHYISPEQARGSRVDNRSDLYSLGVVMYEMLTNRLPYDGDSPVAVAIQHINSMPLMPREINPDIPIGLEEITMKAMSADMDQRYGSAAQMLEDLEEFRKNPEISFTYWQNPDDMQDDEPTQKLDSIPTVMPPKRQVQQPRQQQQVSQTKQRPQREERTEEKEKKTGKTALIAGILCVLLFVCGIGYFLWNFIIKDMISPTDELTVPAVEGMLLSEAQARYGSEFTFEETAEYSDSATQGVIISQNPSAESRTKNSTIKVTVSRGAQYDLMPSLVNMPQTSATVLLGNLSVKVDYKIVQQASESYTAGYVIETIPAENEILRNGDTVTLVVSTGPDLELVKVPDVTGLPQDDAIALIVEVGLQKGTISSYANELPEGTVYYQSLTAFTEVPIGSSVNLLVSTGPAMDNSPEVSTDVSPEGSADVSPTPPVTEGPAVSVQIPSRLTIPIKIPEGEGTVTVTIMYNGIAVWNDVVDRSFGELKAEITGVGSGTADIYFDGELAFSQPVEFSS